MDRKIRLFAGAFAIALIFIFALCGFAAVDLSTDRYIPGQFGPIFQVSALNAQGLSFSFLGEEYLIAPEPFGDFQETLLRYRGLLPTSFRLGAMLAGQGYAAAEEYQEALAAEEALRYEE